MTISVRGSGEWLDSNPKTPHGAHVMCDKRKLFVLMMFAVFVLASASCTFACADDAGCCGDEHAGECGCVCHLPGVVQVDGLVIERSSALESYDPLPTHIKLRQIPFSIFNPPKL